MESGQDSSLHTKDSSQMQRLNRLDTFGTVGAWSAAGAPRMEQSGAGPEPLGGPLPGVYRGAYRGAAVHDAADQAEVKLLIS